jgi:hypothetical protein
VRIKPTGQGFYKFQKAEYFFGLQFGGNVFEYAVKVNDTIKSLSFNKREVLYITVTIS